MPDATIDFASIKSVRADYKRRTVTITIEATLTKPLLEALPPFIQAAQVEKPVRISMTSIQEALSI
jgi:hypothetical protein